MKQSKPIYHEGCWRILRHDGAIVGSYATKALAARAIARAFYLL